MAAGVPDFSNVLLLRGLFQEALLHTGTGEMLSLDGMGHSVCRSDSGFAVIQRSGEENRFAFSLLAFSFHRGVVGNTEFVFGYHRASGESTAVEDYMHTSTRSFAFSSSVELRRLTCELFASEVPRGSASVRWGLTKVLDEAIGSGRESKWLGRHSMQLKSLIAEFGLDLEMHFFPSTRSIVARAAGASDDQDMSEAAASKFGDRDYMVSSLGVLCLMSMLPHRGFKQFCARQKLPEACGFVTDALLSKFVPAKGQRCLTIMLDGKEYRLNGAGAEVSIAGDSSRALATLCKVAPRTGSITQMLVAWAAVVHRPSKYPACVDLAKRFFLRLSAALHDQIESSRGDPMLSATDGLMLSPSRKNGSRRSRQVPWVFKQAVLAAVRKGSYLRSAQQLLAARSILSNARYGNDHQEMSAKAGASFSRKDRLNYMYTCRKVLRDMRWFHFSCDATSVGGRKWLQIAGWSPEKSVGFWCVPQEPLVKTCFVSLSNAQSVV